MSYIRWRPRCGALIAPQNFRRRCYSQPTLPSILAAVTGQIAGAAVTIPVVHIPVVVRRIVSIRRSIKTGATWAHPGSAVIPIPTQLRKTWIAVSFDALARCCARAKSLPSLLLSSD